FQLHWRASTYSRCDRARKHTIDNLDPAVGRTPCRSSAGFVPRPSPRLVDYRFASATVFYLDLRASQLDGGRQRWPPATCIGQGQKPAGGECGARRPCYKATAPNHRDHWGGTSASADPVGPDNSRAHCAT